MEEIHIWRDKIEPSSTDDIWYRLNKYGDFVGWFRYKNGKWTLISRKKLKDFYIETGHQNIIDSIVNGAPENLDTLKEVSDTLNTCIKYTEQTLTEAQKAQARANIDAASLEDIQDMDSATASANAAAELANLKAALVQERLDTADADHQRAENDHSTLDEKISHKANIDGSYDSMAVGLAKNLEGRTNVTDSFFKRTTGGDAEVANGTAQLNEVKGKSQVWNQMVNKQLINVQGKVSKSVEGDVITGVLLNNASSPVGLTHPISGLDISHKYVLSVEARVSAGANTIYKVGAVNDSVSVYASENKSNTSFERVSVFCPTLQSITDIYLARFVTDYSEGNSVEIKYPMLFDLTLIFGAGNEPSTVAEFESWLAENIGEMPYYPYNEGEVLNNKMTGVESIGFNLLDPATGKADIIGAYSDVYGNYYGITGTHGALTFTDKFGNTETITPDSDGKFLLEKAGELSVADAGEDCAVFLWWDGTQTEYKPYEKNVGQLDVTHIYGKLNGEGDYVRVWPTGMPGIGDIKDSLKVVDGQVVAERMMGEVNLGTLNWYEQGGYLRAEVPNDWMARRFSIVNYIEPISTSHRYDSNIENDFVVNNGIILVGNPSERTPQAFIAEVNDKMCYYELITPLIYTDLIYRDSEDFSDGTPVTLPVNYKVDNWGIERIVPQNTEEAVVTASPELTMRYSIDAVEELNTHRDEIDDLYEKNEDLDERKPEKYGEYPDMAVGSAKTLAGQDTKVEDFVFKALDCADGLAKLNSARGKSLVWNQLINISSRDVSKTQNGVTITDNRDGSFTVSTDSEGATENVTLDFSFIRVAGHKYLLKGCPRDGSSSTYALVGNVLGNDYGNGKISTMSESGNLSFPRIVVYTGAIITSPVVFRPQLFDLTLMFGAGNEPATVDEFEAMFPLPYYDYNPGEIISNKTEEVKVVGFNQWDEEWEQGKINTSNGENDASSNHERSKNYIRVLPGSSYFFYCQALVGVTGNQFIVHGYDAEKNYTGFISLSGQNTSIVMPSNVHYIRFHTATGKLQSNTCINLSDAARNGEYEPYKTNTIELNLPTLTGKLNGEGESVVVFPDGLKSSGTVYDEIVGNKAIKRVVVFNKDDITFRSYTDSTKNYVLGEQNAYVGSQSQVNVLSVGGYEATSRDGFLNYDKSVCINSGGVFLIRDTRFTGNAVTDLELISDVTFAVAVKSPKEYILDVPLPDTFQAYKGGTIKQLPENTSVPTTAPMVMTVTYAIDAVGTLVGLPRNYVSKESLQAMLNAMQSAGIIASYTMTYNENTGKYDFTFVAPTNS